jgi:hypothetical protein
MIIEQNNFVNQSLHTIGQQLDRIEEKFSSSPSNEIPSLPEERKSLGLKPRSTKTLEKIESMLSDLKINQSGSSKRISPLTNQMTDSDFSHDSIDFDIRLLEKNFGKEDLEPKVQRIYDKSKSVGFTKKIGIPNLLLQICSLKKDSCKLNSLSLLIRFMNGILMVYLNRNYLIR